MTEEPKTYASESCHAYRRDGTPCYEVPNKSKPGFMRPTTVRDMKRLDLLPSVSTILGIVAKPGLTGWIKDQVARAACEMPVGDGETDDEWVSAVLERADIAMRRARDLGTEIHGAIEEYFKDFAGLIVDVSGSRGYSMHIKAAVDALKDLGVWGQPFSAEKSFASPLGYGGKIDLSGKDECWVVDFKTISTLRKRYDWPERCAQIAAYQIGRYGKLCRGVNIMISTEEPGTYAIREWSMDELKYGWSLFEACFSLWKVISKYDPSLTNPTDTVTTNE